MDYQLGHTCSSCEVWVGYAFMHGSVSQYLESLGIQSKVTQRVQEPNNCAPLKGLYMGIQGYMGFRV